MPTDIDIYRSANLLIERYGEDASIHAAMSADKMMAKGDLDGLIRVNTLKPILVW